MTWKQERINCKFKLISPTFTGKFSKYWSSFFIVSSWVLLYCIVGSLSASVHGVLCKNRGKFKDLTPGKIWANQRSIFFKQLYNGGYHRIATACVCWTLDSWRFLEVSFIHSSWRFLVPLWGCIHKLMFFSIPAYFFKPIGSTTLQAEVCSGRDVCGPTLKVHFKNGKKIYMWQTVGKLHWEMG